MKENKMGTYITLVNWTDQGVKNLKDSPARVEAFRNLCAEQGVELIGFYATMGDYDFIAITQASSADLVGRIVLMVGSMGNVRTKTLRAFDASKFSEIVESLR
ncbi:MAG: GYD domain-containing protein [Planctomycetota bacterium]